MWFVQLVQRGMLNRVSFVLRTKDPLYNHITLEQAVRYAQLTYPDYQIVYCIPLGEWKGEIFR